MIIFFALADALTVSSSTLLRLSSPPASLSLLASSMYSACSCLIALSFIFFLDNLCFPSPIFDISFVFSCTSSFSFLFWNHCLGALALISSAWTMMFRALLASISAILSTLATSSAARTSSMSASSPLSFLWKCWMTCGGTVLDRITAFWEEAVAEEFLSVASFTTSFMRCRLPSEMSVQLMPPHPALAVLPTLCTYVSGLGIS
mmetsp:Transcript_26335/g.52525  ORF Transcript_26335/g.52525 Transcript_26335/m.52525 type:complete len:204 (-) Transcript_26335:1260-1871(-)